MLAVAGGIILAWFVLAFLPELVKLAWWLIKVSALLLIIGVPVMLYIGSW